MGAIATKDLAPAVKEIAGGKWQKAVPLLAGVIGTAAGGPVVGAGAGGSAEFLSELLDNSADKRMKAEEARLDTEQEQAELIADHLRRSLDSLRRGDLDQLQGVIGDLTLEGREHLEQLARLWQRVDEKLDVQDEKLDAQAEALRRMEANRQADHQELLRKLAEEKGVRVQPLQRILERLGEAGVSLEAIPERLSAKADELLALREQLRKLADPEVDEGRANASSLLDEGDLEGARRVLRALRQDIRARRQERSKEEALLLLDEAKIAGVVHGDVTGNGVAVGSGNTVTVERVGGQESSTIEE